MMKICETRFVICVMHAAFYGSKITVIMFKHLFVCFVRVEV